MLRPIPVIASEAKQSSLSLLGKMDCRVAALPCTNGLRLLQAMTARAGTAISGDRPGALLHRLIRQPLELEREWMDERHLALRHHHAGYVALRRDPPLRAGHATPIEFAGRIGMIERRGF